jgi:hypothetical protein
MPRSGLLSAAAAALLGVAAFVGLVAGGTAASAAPIGTLTFNGLTSQDASFTMTTSGPCPEGATNFVITLEGGNIPVPSSSPNLSGNTPGSSLGGGINAGSFTATSQKNLLVFALGNGLAQLGDGAYTATLICRTALSGTSFGEFVGSFTISGNGATITTGGATLAPTLTTAPVVSGSARVGGTLTCTTGTWTDSTSIVVEFLRNNAVVQSSSTVRTRVLAAADLGASVRCRVTASGPGGTGAPALTSPVTVGAGAAARAVAKPKILVSGKVKVGKKLTASRGTWSPTASYAYTYVWKRGSKIVKQGSMASTYKTTKKDKKKTITLIVRAARAGYATGSATSAGVKVK